MTSSAAPFVVALAALAACDKKHDGALDGGPVATTSAAATAPARDRSPKRGEGSAVALAASGDELYVADEEHDAIYVAPGSFGDLSRVRVVAMPGPPAQIVVAGDRVIATVRTLPTDDAKAARATIQGPTPEVSKARRLAAGSLGRREVDLYRESMAPKEYQKYLDDAPLDPPDAGPAPSASAAPKTAPNASAKAPPKAAPPIVHGGTPPKPFDPSVVRKSKGGLLVVLKPDVEKGLVEEARVVLPVDAWGLAVTADGKRAIVSSAWAAAVSVVDLDAVKVLKTLSVAREPRAIVLAKDGRSAFVSHLTGTDLTRIDDLSGDPKASAMPTKTGVARTTDKVSASATLGWSLALSPDGDTLYAPRHAIGADGADSWWGSPVVDVLDVASGKNVAEPRSARTPSIDLGRGRFLPPQEWWKDPSKIPAVEERLVQPRAVVYRKKTDTLLVAGEGRSVVVELDALAPEPSFFVRRDYDLAVYDAWGEYAVRGGAPSALALSSDEEFLYVYCRTTFDLVKIRLQNSYAEWLRFADDALPEDAKRGRRLYADARDHYLSDGLGCESCHPEGRDDGYVWREAKLLGDDEKSDAAAFFGLRATMKRAMNAPDDAKPKLFPRQTPMLAGRTRSPGPYGWHAEAKNMRERLIRASRLHRKANLGWWSDAPEGPQSETQIDALSDFLQSGLWPPPTLDEPLSDAAKRGKEIFESAEAQCSKCHVPATELTDRIAYPLRALPPPQGFDVEKNDSFKTPSLFFLAGSAPYFHDGSRATLEELVEKNGSRMGQTSHLSAEDKAALVAYLRTL